MAHLGSIHYLAGSPNVAWRSCHRTRGIVSLIVRFAFDNETVSELALMITICI